MGLALGRKSGNAAAQGGETNPGLNTEEVLAAKDNGTVLPDIGMAAMLLHQVRYFTDGAIIGSKEFVNAAFAGARERFGAKRKDGARAMRGSAGPARGVLWSAARDLRSHLGKRRIPNDGFRRWWRTTQILTDLSRMS